MICGILYVKFGYSVSLMMMVYYHLILYFSQIIKIDIYCHNPININLFYNDIQCLFNTLKKNYL